MAVYALGDLEPDIAPDAWVHPDAVVIGRVTLGAGASVWPTAVLRGDYGRIEIGAMTNIQDGTIVHCTATEPTIIGAHCVVGHNAHIEGATIGDGALISSGSIVLNGSVIGAGAVVAAGCLVPPRFDLPARRMAMGMPAKIREGFEVDPAMLEGNTQMYHDNAMRYRADLRRLD
ncbi:Carbonic anhydrase or acetyltransferase, isoleucine patch superfamily [Dietzia kunjamensis subsp. schimae]|uniref:Carbonic anhydrase or acetyltransferase, isoleucine patch superfamily n=1 Tax=Dietzia kunjamensis subsp. schimae TaxID=498198 RepID=A0ABY1MWB9_9ACTN|nr:gamma carbonic anhydrase family protein [Dietzia kunjamensis]MBB1015869.1 gamma carbonic anhydrase family protein [Dietzia kunjamensis subsp. schimae]SMO36579.1 Carbonic anhydrase or acetyltransferase, isoleucine patch superfamily [Dietzia kunjamensis subsp. schimae]